MYYARICAISGYISRKVFKYPMYDFMICALSTIKV